MKLPFSRVPMSCQQFVELVTSYLEHSLPARLQHSIDDHLNGCTECAEYLAQFRRTTIVLGELAEVPPIPEALLERLSAAFVEANALGLQDGQEP